MVLFEIKAKENDRGGNYKVMSAIKFSGETERLKQISYCIVCFLFLAPFLSTFNQELLLINELCPQERNNIKTVKGYLVGATA